MSAYTLSPGVALLENRTSVEVELLGTLLDGELLLEDELFE